MAEENQESSNNSNTISGLADSDGKSINEDTAISGSEENLKINDLNNNTDILSGQPVENKIDEGEIASLTLFDPDIKYKFSKDHIISKSKNSCFIDSDLTGKSYVIISNNSKVIIGN